jgi:hypothetical protein
MREMSPVNTYKIAHHVITINSRGEQRPEAEYWNPREIDGNANTFKFGHRLPN